jgi:uncharacterized protein (TIGR03382 family)
LTFNEDVVSPSKETVLGYRLRVSAIFVLHGLILSTWISRIPSAQADFHLSTGTLGVVLLCSAAGSMISMPIAGMLVARIGSRRIVQVASICFGGALVGPVLSANAWQLAASLFFFGAMGGCMNVAMNEQAILVESAAQKPMFASFHASFSLGGMLGAFAGGLAVDHEISFGKHLLTGAVILCLGVWISSRGLLDNAVQSAIDSSRLVLRLAPSILTWGLLALCAGIGEGSMADWTGIYLHTQLGASLGRAAFGYAVFSTAMLAGRFLGDWLTQAFGSQRCIEMGLEFAAAGVSLSLLTHSLSITLAGFAIAGLGLSVVIPNVFRMAARVQGLAPGYGLAAATTMGYLGLLTGPPVIGGLAQLFSLRLALLFVVIAMVIGAALMRMAPAGARRTWTSEMASGG